MITDQDIEKLKQVFATKKDLEQFATKEDLNRFATKEDLKRFATKEDLERFVTKEDFDTRLDTMSKEIVNLFNSTNQRIDRIDEKIDRNNEIILEILQEIRTHRIVLGDHEKRFQKVEAKLFPSP